MVPAKLYDARFDHPGWRENTWFNTQKSYYLLFTHWLEDAIYQTPETDAHAKAEAAFWMRMLLDVISPSNFIFSNPEVLDEWRRTHGRSLLQGTKQLIGDMYRGNISMVDDSSFEVGKNLATTEGAVVMRNELLELIQYSPKTEQVYTTPILIISPWINKFYVLDLTKNKSLINFLVTQGFTVFVTSWRNPDAKMRNTTMEDYLQKGVLQSIEAVNDICNVSQLHLVGYCLGGTLAVAALAWINNTRKRKLPVAHATLLTTLVDFSEPGDIKVFTNEDSIKTVEKLMAKKGFLDGKYMAATFRLLRSNSLIWYYFIHNYLLGKRPPAFDVLFWNMDTTRMPEAMHKFYLREFYQANKLIKSNAITLLERTIDTKRIKQPLYVVTAEQDDIVPWQQGFKINTVTQSPIRFVLATSGHIMGIINPPLQPPKRRYWVSDVDTIKDAHQWRRDITKTRGSWWLDWIDWLDSHCGDQSPARQLGSKNYPVLCKAPGNYVLQK